MAYFRLPLSGDVWQDINPFRWIFRSAGPMSLFSINLGQSSEPSTEQAVLDVASYGKQLGRVGEALAAVLEHTNTNDYSPEQRKAIEDFMTLSREIGAAKQRAAAPRSRGTASAPQSARTTGTMGKRAS
jgi:hypothetical protein